VRDETPARRDPGHVEASLVWSADTPIQTGARVEATDGVVGTLRARVVGQGPEHAYLGLDTDEGLLFVPERLIRELRGDTVLLSLPRADVIANSSHGTLPVQPDATDLPVEPR